MPSKNKNHASFSGSHNHSKISNKHPRKSEDNINQSNDHKIQYSDQNDDTEVNQNKIELDQNTANNVLQLEHNLIEDGVVISSTDKVVSRSSKVNTAFASQYAHVKKQPVSELGNKSALSLADLKKRFGFSWKKFGQKFGLFFLTFGILGLVGVSLVGTWVVDQWNLAPDPDQILNGTSSQSSVVLARDGKTELFKFFDKENREIIHKMEPEKAVDTTWNPNSENYIPQSMQVAMLALEDENFYSNQDGIPWSNLLGASVKCLTSALSDCRGASGISQQLVKNVTSDNESTLDRKARELFTALKLGNNQNYDKTKVLNLYLNTVGFGRNAHGVQAASQSYFKKDIKDIQIQEACFLASLPQNPVAYNKSLSQPESEDYKRLILRKDSCLQKLVDKEIKPGNGLLLTQDKANELKKAALNIVDFRRDRKFPHFLDYVEQELQDKKLLADTPQGTQDALAKGGYKIITTIDPVKQGRVEQIFAEDVDRAIYASGANNGAGLVLDGPTGEILAMVGSVNYNKVEIDGQVNITTSPQAPGSSFKPYVYAAAFEKNFNPGTVIVDVKTTFEGNYSPSNFSKTFGGPVTIRSSLQNSLNIPAIKALYLASGSGNYSNGEQGVAEVSRVAEAVGVRFPVKNSSPCTVSMAIGTCEVTMVSHATGMNTFAQSGKLRTATPFISITKIDGNGKEVDIYKDRMNGEKNQVPYPQNDRAIDPAIANQVADVMSDYAARSGSWGRGIELDGWRAAAKTGTSTLIWTDGIEKASDLWVVGYTPLYTTTIWVGNTRGEPVSDNATGGGFSAILWKDIMTYLHEGKEPVGFSKEGLTQYKVNCTGATYCKNVEWLTPGQVKALTNFDGKILKADYNPNKTSIFENRNEFFFRKIKVHKADKKIPKPGTVENLLEEIECVESPSAFPLSPAWFNPAQQFAKARFADKICPTEESTYDSSKVQSNIQTNLTSSSLAPSQILINASSPYSGVSITQIKLIIGGIGVATSSNGSLLYTEASSQTGTLPVVVEVTDSLGNITNQSYTDVSFNFTPLASGDISSIVPSCSPNSVTVGTAVNCTFNLPNGKTLPTNFKMYIGSNTTGATCLQSVTTINCSNIPTIGNLPGTANIKGGVSSSANFSGSITIT